MSCLRVIRFLPIFFIIFYKVLFSPWMGGCCRYIPSCSEYALQGFKTDTFLRAFFLSLKRILRCHPYGYFGYDPYPKICLMSNLEKR